MATLNTRVAKLETQTIRRHKYTPPDPAEQVRRAERFIDRIASICRSCSERMDDRTDVIFVDLLTCNAGRYAFHCQTFKAALLARANDEDDQAEKDELMRLYGWLNGDRLRDGWKS